MLKRYIYNYRILTFSPTSLIMHIVLTDPLPSHHQSLENFTDFPKGRCERSTHTVWRTFLGGVPPFWWISGLGTQHPCCMCGCISSFLLSTWSCAQSVAERTLAGYLSAPRHVLWPHLLRLFYLRATEHIQLHLTTSKWSLIPITAVLLQGQLINLGFFQTVRVISS